MVYGLLNYFSKLLLLVIDITIFFKITFDYLLKFEKQVFFQRKVNIFCNSLKHGSHTKHFVSLHFTIHFANLTRR